MPYHCMNITANLTAVHVGCHLRGPQIDLRAEIGSSPHIPEAADIRAWVMSPEGVAALKGKGKKSEERLTFIGPISESKRRQVTAGNANIAASNVRAYHRRLEQVLSRDCMGCWVPE